MRVLVSRALTGRVSAVLRERFGASFRPLDAPMTLAEARAALAEYDAIVPTLGDAFGAAAFAGPVRAKLLANFGVGTNHIDVAAARAAGVAVTNTPGAVTDATADIAMMLLLMSARPRQGHAAAASGHRHRGGARRDGDDGGGKSAGFP
jgi:gluconate 2-dehydrogenase